MKKVLVVEDDNISMELVSEILNAEGFKTEAASNGLEAIRMTDKVLYDIILMDIELPGMDGIEATRIIKNRIKYKDVPIIAYTASAMRGDKERIMKAGLDDYISKPIDVSDFINRMEKYRNGKKNRLNQNSLVIG
ncbi:MAG: response regulator [Candidatus Methanoperedens sp.]|nr:response regulator [Candidatus Methanoperedens sp.]